MKASTVILAVGGVGVAALLVRALMRASSPEKSGGGDLCAAAASVAAAAGPKAAGAAYLGCKALGAVANDWNAWDAENKRLNGEVDAPLTRAVMFRVNRVISGSPWQLNPTMHGTVARFKNGCVPFKDARGFEKCAPGTHSMRDTGGLAWTRRYGDGKAIQVKWDEAFTGREGDPFIQGPFRKGISTDFEGGMELSHEKQFGPLAEGERGYEWHGRSFTCPEGQEPVRDQRGGVLTLIPCGESNGFEGTNAVPPPSGGGGGGDWWSPTKSQHTDLQCIDGKAPAGFTWVDATSTTPGHWERLRAGQTVNNGPCGSPTTSPTSALRSTVNATLAVRL